MKYRYIFVYSQNAWSILAIPIMLVFTLGVLWRGATASAATATFLVILPFVAVPFVLGDDSWDRAGDIYVSVGHVNLTLSDRPPQAGVPSIPRPG